MCSSCLVRVCWVTQPGTQGCYQNKGPIQGFLLILQQIVKVTMLPVYWHSIGDILYLKAILHINK